MNVAAIERNCARLRTELRGGAALCAVVKADGYGHGARAERARGARRRRALAGGRRRRARRASCARPASPSADPRDGRAQRERAREALGRRRRRGRLERGAIWSAVAAAGRRRACTSSSTPAWAGSGTRDPAEATRVAAAAPPRPSVELVGAMTHFATADELRDDGLLRASSSSASRAGRGALEREHPALLVHAANSAAMLRDARRAVRHGALRHRGLRHGPVRRGPRRARRSSRRSS